MYKILNQRNGLTFVEITNETDFSVTLSNYGASIYKIDTLDRIGKLETVTLSPRMINYYKNPGYYGLTVARVAGRIKDSKYKIGDKEYNIWPPNERNNILHSGVDTLAYKLFDYAIIKSNDDEVVVRYSIHIKDMEDSFPGNLDLRIEYKVSLKEKSILCNIYALSDKDTLLNITNHSYFNLSGNLKTTIEKHYLMMNKELVAETDDELLIKDIIPVPKEYDFRKSHYIDEFLRSKRLIDKGIGGYDDIYTGVLPLKLELIDKNSGRKLEIESDYKDVVIYTNNIPSTTAFPNMERDKAYNGIAIEPCRYSDILSKKGLVHKANALYNHYIKYTFSLVEDKQ